MRISIADQPRDFLLPDGRLEMGKLLEGFAAFWKAFGASMAQGENYHEAAAQLVFQAYLQRIVNGGGWVDREYGLGWAGPTCSSASPTPTPTASPLSSARSPSSRSAARARATPLGLP